MHTLTCVGCGEPFDAKSPRAKWCSSACRKRVQRAGATPAEPPPAELDDFNDHSLVATTRRELETAGRTETFAGQLALQLAKRLADPGESGISALSKELRTVMAAALEGVTPPAGEQPDAPESSAPEEDEVTRARRQREEARQAAGLA